jgi:CRISPR/Cas system-associated endoribonuclease Cas2
MAQADLTAVNTLTVYYVDNSQTSVYGKLNTEVIQSLRERVSSLQDDKQDYFLAYLSNGQQGKFSSTEKDFLDRDLPEFLDRKTRGGNYEWDKQTFREFFLTQFQYKVKQSVELNFYLSAYSIYNLKNKLGDLPSPLSLAGEIPLYLNNPEVNVKVNYFISKPDEVTQDKDFNPTAITELLDFYIKDIGKGRIRQRVMFL